MNPRTLLASIIISLSCAASCGGSVESQGSTGGTSTAALCAGAPRDNGDGTATALACPFEQQAYNVTMYGTALATGAKLSDASGVQIGSVTQSCDKWLLATDPQGVTVLIDNATGEVRAHGMFHAGQPMTTLPEHLALPLAVR